MFGWGRHHDRLTVNSTPLTQEEIATEVKNYSQYISNFNRERATRFRLSYVVMDADGSLDFSNLYRWYTRDTGERIGKFMLYRVRLR